MYSWIVGRIGGFVYEKVRKGDLRLASLWLAQDARFFFPGTNSFGGEQRGKAAIVAWMRLFAALRPDFTVHDTAAAGLPWNMRIFVRIREIRVHLDTEKVAAFDTELGPAAKLDPRPRMSSRRRRRRMSGRARR